MANIFPLIFCAKKRTFCCAMTNKSGDNMFRLNASFDVGLNLVNFSVPCLANIYLFLVLWFLFLAKFNPRNNCFLSQNVVFFPKYAHSNGTLHFGSFRLILSLKNNLKLNNILSTPRLIALYWRSQRVQTRDKLDQDINAGF